MSAYPPPFSPVYDAAMTTPVLIAAAARKPRRNPRAVQHPGGEGGGKKAADNYRAQGAKKAAGARLGNRNAVRRDAAAVDRHARVKALVHQSCTLAAAIQAAAAWNETVHRRLVLALAKARP